jgi:hypothetical protein
MNDQYLVYAIVALAALYLLRYAYRKLRNIAGGDSCAGCGNCGKPNTPRPEGVRQAPQATPLVSLSTGTRLNRPKPSKAPQHYEG